MRIPLLLVLLGGSLWLLSRTRGEEEEETLASETGTGGVIPKKGRTWDLANWSEVAAAKGISVPPPGLPASARKPSARGAAIPAVLAAAGTHGIPGFPEMMKALAMNESGGRFALPAWTYDTRPKSQRPPGKSYISAWGVYQWQNAHVKHNFGKANAYQMTPEEEIDGTVARYANRVKNLGSDPAAGLLWHISPAAYKKAGELYAAGTPLREALHAGAASRGKHWAKVFNGYLKKWQKEYPAALS